MFLSKKYSEIRQIYRVHWTLLPYHIDCRNRSIGPLLRPPACCLLHSILKTHLHTLNINAPKTMSLNEGGRPLAALPGLYLTGCELLDNDSPWPRVAATLSTSPTTSSNSSSSSVENCKSVDPNQKKKKHHIQETVQRRPIIVYHWKICAYLLPGRSFAWRSDSN